MSTIGMRLVTSQPVIYSHTRKQLTWNWGHGSLFLVAGRHVSVLATMFQAMNIYTIRVSATSYMYYKNWISVVIFSHDFCSLILCSNGTYQWVANATEGVIWNESIFVLFPWFQIDEQNTFLCIPFSIVILKCVTQHPPDEVSIYKNFSLRTEVGGVVWPPSLSTFIMVNSCFCIVAESMDEIIALTWTALSELAIWPNLS